MRNFTKALTVVSLLAPVSGYSLGIGDIRVRSALNQNLNAEIKLIVSPNENPNSIKVNLAPPERFDSAGVSWSYFLSKVRFKTVVKPNGSVVVRVTSTEALKEPYLNFLLEVSWPKGNLYREFTVLVDPPAEYHEPSYQAVQNYEPYYPQEEAYAQPRPKAVARRSVNRPRYRPNPAGSYGGQVVARRNDTLWRVAARARGGSGVSVEQMMMALYDQNPHAFFQPNVNALSAGKTLKVPAKNVVQQTSRQQALAEFDRHNEAWRNHTVLPQVEETQVAKEQPVDNQLKLVAPTESSVGGAETVAPSSEQGASTKPAGSASGISGQTDAKTSTPKDSSPAVDQAVQTKLDALQKQLETMQQIIDLKDKQLADLQKSGDAKPEVTPTPLPPTVQPEPSAEVKPVETNPPVEVKPALPVEPVPPAVTMTPRPGEPIEPVQPIEQPKPVVKPALTPEPVARDSDSSFLGIIGAMVLTLLSLLGWMWWRKQKMMEETDAESMFGNYSILRSNEVMDQQSSVSRGGAASGAGSALAEESSFLNDFKASDFESFESFNVDHGDIDPVAEADVYLAYGRYQQAEDLIKQAVIDSPERDECKLKLLEIYQVSENSAAFEAYAAELAAAGKKEDKDFWDKVVELSKDISEDGELFSTTSAPAIFDAKESDVLTENVMVSSTSSPDHEKITKIPEDAEHLGEASFVVDDDEDFIASNFDTSLPASPDQGQTSQSDFQAEKIQLNTNQANFNLPSDDFKPAADNESVEFDLGPYPGSNKTATTALSDNANSIAKQEGLSHSGETQQIAGDLESYDFDFDAVKKDLQKPVETAKAEIDDSWDPEQTIDFSFDEKIEPKAPNNPEMDFNFDFNEASTPEQPLKTSALQDSMPLSDLTDMDEIETKLDLAKAYIDMGDPDSAKDIIIQVMEIGNNEQKKSAQQLLKELEM